MAGEDNFLGRCGQISYQKIRQILLEPALRIIRAREESSMVTHAWNLGLGRLSREEFKLASSTGWVLSSKPVWVSMSQKRHKKGKKWVVISRWAMLFPRHREWLRSFSYTPLVTTLRHEETAWIPIVSNFPNSFALWESYLSIWTWNSEAIIDHSI